MTEQHTFFMHLELTIIQAHAIQAPVCNSLSSVGGCCLALEIMSQR